MRKEEGQAYGSKAENIKEPEYLWIQAWGSIATDPCVARRLCRRLTFHRRHEAANLIPGHPVIWNAPLFRKFGTIKPAAPEQALDGLYGKSTFEVLRETLRKDLLNSVFKSGVVQIQEPDKPICV